MSDGLEILVGDPATAEARALLDAGEAYAESLYPVESNHFLSVEELRQPAVTFLIARDDGRAVGCGAVVLHGGHGELKRIFVAPEARGRRIGARLLDALEVIARRAGVKLLRLETGVKQPEALGLYRAAGYVERPPFGDYLADPLSVFMEKRLA